MIFSNRDLSLRLAPLALISIGFDFSQAISALLSIKVNFVPKGDRSRPQVDLKRPEKLLDTKFYICKREKLRTTNLWQSGR